MDFMYKSLVLYMSAGIDIKTDKMFKKELNSRLDSLGVAGFGNIKEILGPVNLLGFIPTAKKRSGIDEYDFSQMQSVAILFDAIRSKTGRTWGSEFYINRNVVSFIDKKNKNSASIYAFKTNNDNVMYQLNIDMVDTKLIDRIRNLEFGKTEFGKSKSYMDYCFVNGNPYYKKKFLNNGVNIVINSFEDASVFAQTFLPYPVKIDKFLVSYCTKNNLPILRENII